MALRGLTIGQLTLLPNSSMKFLFFYQTCIFDIFRHQISDQSPNGDYLNLSTLLWISVAFQMNTINLNEIKFHNHFNCDSLLWILFGIHLPGKELLDSLVRTEFRIGLFQVVVIWLSTKFSSGLRHQQVWCHSHCDVSATLTSLQHFGGHPPMAAI